MRLHCFDIAESVMKVFYCKQYADFVWLKFWDAVRVVTEDQSVIHIGS